MAEITPVGTVYGYPQVKVRDKQHALDFLKQVEALGGEGVMLRQLKPVMQAVEMGSC